MKLPPDELKTSYDDALKYVGSKLGVPATKKTIDAYDLAITSRSRRPGLDNVIVLSGISGSGKTTIGEELKKRYGFEKSRTVYTRERRPTEADDDGIFVDESQYKEWLAQDKFLVSSITNNSYHGILRESIATELGDKRKIWLDRSVRTTERLLPLLDLTPTLVYVLAPTFNLLYERLVARAAIDTTLAERDIYDRLVEEIEELRLSVDLPYIYVVNDTLERVVNEIAKELLKVAK